MAAAMAIFYFRLRIGGGGGAAVLGRRKSINQPNFVETTHAVHGWDITTSAVNKQTSVILEYYFRITFRPCRWHQHFILQRRIKFHCNRTTRGGVMMSYLFSRWRPRQPRSAASGFVFDDVTCLPKVKIYLSIKLRKHIAQFLAEILQLSVCVLFNCALAVWLSTASSFVKSSYLVTYGLRKVKMNMQTKFHPNRATRGEDMTYYRCWCATNYADHTNLMRCPATMAPPRELHRDCCKVGLHDVTTYKYTTRSDDMDQCHCHATVMTAWKHDIHHPLFYTAAGFY